VISVICGQTKTREICAISVICGQTKTRNCGQRDPWLEAHPAISGHSSSARRLILAIVVLKVYPADAPIAAFVVAHGAGAGQTSQFMVRAAAGLAARAISTATFDFPYITAGRRIPDRAPVLESAWRDAIDAARREWPGLSLFIGGKSMGGRIASHVASQGGCGPLAGLVFFGYPLHPPGKPQQRRDAHLPAIAEPMIFIQGSNDQFGSAGEIRSLLPSLQRATLQEIPGGDHSFKVPGGKARQDPVIASVLDTAAAWMAAHRPGP
jgi:predicted alpha/beta-hydrolase family hydrolase